MDPVANSPFKYRPAPRLARNAAAALVLTALAIAALPTAAAAKPVGPRGEHRQVASTKSKVLGKFLGAIERPCRRSRVTTS